MRLKSPKFQVIFLLLLSGFLRLFWLGVQPVSLNLDEVAIGYNAYSIAHTFRDEYGKYLPIAFRSHDDYKAPLYIYLTSIFVWFFGLNPWVVRISSALMGTLAIPLTYLMLKEWLSLQSTKLKQRYEQLPFITAIFLAINPWHLQFSRAGFEVTVATTLIIAGVWSYFKGLSNKNWWSITILTFTLSLFTYHSNKIFLPIFGLVLFIQNWKSLINAYKPLLIWSAIALICLLPLLKFSLTPEGQLRFKGTSVFNTPTLVQTNQDQRIMLSGFQEIWLGKIFLHRYFSYFQVILNGYFKHFTFDFLFSAEGGPPRIHAPNVGLLYLWELPLILIGIGTLFYSRLLNKSIFIFWWLLTPIASALTWDSPSSVRTLIQLPTWQIFSGLGLIVCYQYSKKYIAPKVFILSSIGLVSFSLSWYLFNYIYLAPKINAEYWQYGYSEAVEYAQKNLDNYDQVVVSTNLKLPQNFFAFYTAYDPETYINKDGGTVSGGYEETRNAFGKFKFHPIDWQHLESKTLYIELSNQVPSQIKPTQIISLPNGKPYISIIK